MVKLTLDEKQLKVMDRDVVLQELDVNLDNLLQDNFRSVDIRYHDTFRDVMVIERPPQRYTLMNAVLGNREADQGYGQGAPVESVSIPVPWQVYVVNYRKREAYMYFRNEQTSSLDDELFLPYTDHTKDNGLACAEREGEYHGRIADTEDPYQLTKSLINETFWAGKFWGFSYVYPLVPKQLEPWKKERAGLRNPNFHNYLDTLELEDIMKFDLVPLSRTDRRYRIHGERNQGDCSTIKDVIKTIQTPLSINSIAKKMSTKEA